MVSSSLDPDHAPHFVMHDLGPNCFQSLSAGKIELIFHVNLLSKDLYDNSE